eukprot:3255069-Pyramimonas_sp.AAC.1
MCRRTKIPTPAEGRPGSRRRHEEIIACHPERAAQPSARRRSPPSMRSSWAATTWMPSSQWARNSLHDDQEDPL